MNPANPPDMPPNKVYFDIVMIGACSPTGIESSPTLIEKYCWFCLKLSQVVNKITSSIRNFHERPLLLWLPKASKQAFDSLFLQYELEGSDCWGT